MIMDARAKMKRVKPGGLAHFKAQRLYNGISGHISLMAWVHSTRDNTSPWIMGGAAGQWLPYALRIHAAAHRGAGPTIPSDRVTVYTHSTDDRGRTLHDGDGPLLGAALHVRDDVSDRWLADVGLTRVQTKLVWPSWLEPGALKAVLVMPTPIEMHQGFRAA